MDAEDEKAPALVAPRDASAVDGSEVTFVWEPVEATRTYRLQVARTARFEDPVVDADVGTETAVTVGNQFPTDGQTFFWRVLSESEAGGSVEGAVESFIATTEAEAEVPEAEEEPVTELARADRREGADEVFEFTDRFEKEKERGVAYEGVAASQIMGIAVSIIVVVLVAVSVLFGWFEQVSQKAEASAIDRLEYEQIRQAKLEATKHLQQYGVLDKEEGIYHIPINRAMELIATEEYQRQQSQ